MELGKDSPDFKYYEMAFGKRPDEALYDIKIDPDCVVNLAENPEYASIKKKLFTKMVKELERQQDPRILGKGEIFDYYPIYFQERLKEMNYYGDKYYDMNKLYKEKFGREPVPMPPDTGN